MTFDLRLPRKRIVTAFARQDAGFQGEACKRWLERARGEHDTPERFRETAIVMAARCAAAAYRYAQSVQAD